MQLHGWELGAVFTDNAWEELHVTCSLSFFFHLNVVRWRPCRALLQLHYSWLLQIWSTDAHDKDYQFTAEVKDRCRLGESSSCWYLVSLLMARSGLMSMSFSPSAPPLMAASWSIDDHDEDYQFITKVKARQQTHPVVSSLTAHAHGGFMSMSCSPATSPPTRGCPTI